MEKKLFGIFAFLFCTTVCIHAQVNIGTLDPPHEAALLDLSQKETGAPSRGLLLPRVSLDNVSIFKLPGTGNSMEEQKATGMTVYNLNKQTIGGTGIGIYVWDGEKWRPINIEDDCTGCASAPDVTFSPNTYRTAIFDGLRVWIDFSKEGNPTQSTYSGQTQGERGYYYAHTTLNATAACPSGWHLPTEDEFLKLKALFERCRAAYDVFIQGGYNGMIETGIASPEQGWDQFGSFCINIVEYPYNRWVEYNIDYPGIFLREDYSHYEERNYLAGVRCIENVAP